MAHRLRWTKGLLIWLMMAATLSVGSTGQAQDVEVVKPKATDESMDTTKHPVAVTMALQADSFFGFNPSVYGTYGLTDNLALAFNFTYWTMISGVGVHDNNPWLETDVGINLTLLDKRLSITPMIGFVHGQLLSSRGGFFPNGGGSVNERTTAFEGAVPNITVNYLDRLFEAEFYLGYYKAIRSEGEAPVTAALFVHRSGRGRELSRLDPRRWPRHLGLSALLGERGLPVEQHVVDGDPL